MENELCLSFREKIILKQYYIDGQTNEKVGRQFNITSERVKQIKDRAVKEVVLNLDLSTETKKSNEFYFLSTRARNVLEFAGILNLTQLTQMTAKQILALRNCGRTTAKEIERGLADCGLTLVPNKTLTEREARKLAHHSNAIQKILAS